MRDLLIGLTMRVTQADAYPEARDSISHDWLRCLGAWGMTPVLIPNIGASSALDRVELDLLVLTGGDDIGETPERDQTERGLLLDAIARRTPVIGVCRGLQLINDHFQGETAPVSGHVAKPHPVALRVAWEGFYGSSATVNSFHGRAVPPESLGKDLQVTAVDDEGHVEGFIHATLPIAAVMWHPERAAAPAGDEALFRHIAQSGSAGR